MKRNYIQPLCEVNTVATETGLLAATDLTNITGNGEIKYGGSGNGTGDATPMSGFSYLWDDEEEDD